MSEIEKQRLRIVEAWYERAALEDKALNDGKFWTVQIAYHHDHAFAKIWFGKPGVRDLHFFTEVEHREAGMFLDPTVILGDKLHVRQQVCKMANSDNFTIRVVGAPKPMQIVPGIEVVS